MVKVVHAKFDFDTKCKSFKSLEIIIWLEFFQFRATSREQRVEKTKLFTTNISAFVPVLNLLSIQSKKNSILSDTRWPYPTVD